MNPDVRNDRHGFASAPASMSAASPGRGRLIYLMGASGSGKDSLLQWLSANLAPDAPVRIARRSITRPESINEAAEALTVDAFEQRLQAGAFTMHWRSHGLRYGIGAEIDASLANGEVVIVNGSRAYLKHACERYPHLEAVEIAVTRETLRKRLLARGRESEAEVEARLERADLPFTAPSTCRIARIPNDTTLAAAGALLLKLVLGDLRAQT